MKLPQSTDVWEGDRRSLLPSGLQIVNESTPLDSEHYVLWVNGTAGTVRTIGIVESSSDMDALVALLVEAIESPRSPTQQASRPRLIWLRDRELYLYLQSIAQALHIQLELLPELPVIDQVFEKLNEFRASPPPLFLPKYGDFLLQSAENVWKTAPWVLLEDHQTLEVELNQWGLGTLYVTVLGNLGLDFGVLAYRNLESLKTFRAAAIARGSLAEMEAAFLGQNCLFLNYEFDAPSTMSWMARLLPFSRVEPSFGSLNGRMIPFLEEDETIAFAVILEAVHRFISQNRGKFQQGAFPALMRRQKIVIPEIAGIKSPLTVKVSTLPQLAETFMATAEASELEDPDDCEIRQDLIPDRSFISMTLVSWDSLDALRSQAFYHQSATVKPLGDGFPVLVVQTSAAKAKVMIKQIREMGGLLGIGLNPAVDPMGNACLLGLLKMQDDTIALVTEIDETDPNSALVVKNWRKRCKVTKNYCALLIAKGNSGKTKGKPLITDTIGFFEVKALSEKELDLDVIGSSFGD